MLCERCFIRKAVCVQFGLSATQPMTHESVCQKCYDVQMSRIRGYNKDWLNPKNADDWRE